MQPVNAPSKLCYRVATEDKRQAPVVEKTERILPFTLIENKTDLKTGKKNRSSPRCSTSLTNTCRTPLFIGQAEKNGLHRRQAARYTDFIYFFSHVTYGGVHLDAGAVFTRTPV